ncbi:hypothetical protein SBBP2_1100014 [Burkholderiales bacterium]|nr:hypothetical protein SBBP2_1100014 [Burkholderiales bacterium]
MPMGAVAVTGVVAVMGTGDAAAR